MGLQGFPGYGLKVLGNSPCFFGHWLFFYKTGSSDDDSKPTSGLALCDCGLVILESLGNPWKSLTRPLSAWGAWLSLLPRGHTLDGRDEQVSPWPECSFHGACHCPMSVGLSWEALLLGSRPGWGVLFGDLPRLVMGENGGHLGQQRTMVPLLPSPLCGPPPLH